MNIREITKDDALNFINLVKQIEKESDFMLFEPDERKITLEQQDWSVQHNIHRLELTVMNHNERAITLYRKAGFEIEGTKRNSLFVNGTYIDEYYMSKLVDTKPDFGSSSI